ncbi:MAG: dicarboxylate/amino acid:cation symporter [Marinifilaceae bacterium]
MVKKVMSSTLFKLIMGVVIGLIAGRFVGEGFMNVIVSLKYMLGQFVFFMVPLIILSFISSSIAKMGANASKLLGWALCIAYLSSICAAFMSMILGYTILPHMSIPAAEEAGRALPPLVFKLDIPQVMSVMSALVLALMIGVATVWTKSELFTNILDGFQKIVLQLINRILIPILPLFIAANFCALSYEGTLTRQLPVFFNVLLIVLAAHFVWLVILYLIGGAVLRKSPWQVIRYYFPPYFTAVGTMSSAATLPVSLEAAEKSPVLDKKVVDFSIPLFSNIHLCGSILTEVFFVMTVSLMLYGTLPSVGTMVLFIFLLGIFAVGAPGVPGGTVIASMGIVISILGFDATGTALLLTVFALQDSFGTACNVVGDGALTMIMTRVEANEAKRESFK